MEILEHMGRGCHTVTVRRTGGETIKTVMTSPMGILRCEVPHGGSFDLICRDDPSLSKMKVLVRAEIFTSGARGIIL